MQIHSVTVRDPAGYHQTNHVALAHKTEERLTKDSLLAYTLKHELFNTGQHGFLRTIYCAICITDCLNPNIRGVKTGRSIIVIVLELIVALDEGFHPRLLNRINFQDVLDPTLSWCSSQPPSIIQMAQVDSFISEPSLPITPFGTSTGFHIRLPYFSPWNCRPHHW